MSVFDYEALEALGIDTVTITYNGENDEGYIEEIEPTPEVDEFYDGSELYDTIEQQAYAVLEREHGGWEINEGSHGHITITVKERKAFLHHGSHRVETDWFDKNI